MSSPADRRTLLRCIGATAAWPALEAAGLTAAVAADAGTSGGAQKAGEAPVEQPVIDEIRIGGARLELQFDPAFEASLRMRAHAWVQAAAGAITAYLGRFPVADVELLMLPAPGAGVRGGTTFGEPSPYVRLRVGVATTAQQFRDDWVLVHEMVHLAVPRVPRRHAWLQEGLATYAEGIARTRAGQISVPRLWAAMASDMPQGQPAAGDRGLDHTPTWGRTYWGGAIFCLLADVGIRRRSGLALGLEHALRGVLAAGGSYAVTWPIERILAVADAAVEQDTLASLYARMKDSPSPTDLAALWRELGVVPEGTQARFRSDAPLAAVRAAIAG
jgi:hypothetical protein